MLHRTTNGSGRGLLLVGTLPPPSGGIAVHIADVGRALAAAGTPVRFADVPPGSSRTPSAAARLALGLGLARSRGDVVHVHTNGHNDGSWRLVRAVSVVGGDALVTLHSGFAPDYIDANRARCRTAASGFHRVVCVNPAIAAALARAGVAEDKLIVAPAFSPSLLPIAMEPAGLAAIRRRHPVLLAATLAHGVEYGAESLLAAFALLQRNIPEVALLLYGPAAREPAIDSKIGEAGAAHVYRLGDLHRGEVLGLLRLADVFVRPTLTDGDAISVRESLALGVRTVASDAAPRPAGVRTFHAGDAQAMAGAITEALGRPRPAALGEDGLGPVFRVYQQLGLRAPQAEAAFAVTAEYPVAPTEAVAMAARESVAATQSNTERMAETITETFKATVTDTESAMASGAELAEVV